MSISRLMLLLTTLLAITGCHRDATTMVQPAETWPDPGRVVVVPFANRSAAPGAGRILADLVASGLRERSFGTVLPAEQVRATLSSREGEELAPDVLGDLLQADTLVTGQVHEWRYKQTLGEKPAVGFTLTIIEAASGRVLFDSSRGSVGATSLFVEDSRTRLALELVDKVLSNLPEEL